MPRYMYRCRKCSHAFEQTFESYKERKDVLCCPECGWGAIYDFGLTHHNEMHAKPGTWNNHKSLAMAVHADQVQERIEWDRKLGVHAEYVPDGKGLALPKFDSLRHQRSYLKAHGFFNKDSYY